MSKGLTIVINIFKSLHYLGASSGIGAATSVLFAKLGAVLTLSGRNEANLQKTAKECETHGVKVLLSNYILWAHLTSLRSRSFHLK